MFGACNYVAVFHNMNPIFSLVFLGGFVSRGKTSEAVLFFYLYKNV